MKQKLLIIVGPTSSGKSALGVELAKKFNGEVISADSRQVYKGLDIATGKITKREMKGVPHHLLDVAHPKKSFSADDFVKHARKEIEDMSARGKLPIIVGGTGFYIDSLVGRITLPNVPPNPAFRSKNNNLTVVRLLFLLKKLDPVRAKMLSTPSERNNKARLLRALEIATTLGKNPVPATADSYDMLWIGVNRSNKELQARIVARVKARMRTGMVEEARRLKKAGLSYKRMTELGLEYRSLAKFLQRKINHPELEEEIRTGNWQYTRKQIIYWKRNKDIHWFDPKASSKISAAVQKWLT
jgi:tRNA dimethylallyltransferase